MLPVLVALVIREVMVWVREWLEEGRCLLPFLAEQASPYWAGWQALAVQSLLRKSLRANQFLLDSCLLCCLPPLLAGGSGGHAVFSWLPVNRDF